MTAHLLRLATIASLMASALFVAGCDTTKNRSSSTPGGGSGTTNSSAY
ncbi:MULTISPECIES: hypothetical protein [Ramlibacter]|uniref:Peptidoglycan-associated lipoprotein n=1 Tax=Ramlibacter pinisoli TaxID=2682844 RepID=A0A6N8J042_9BURK|nr:MULTISPECIES: hypothetical protein [Ramlibacter]MBA2961670.1 hypothetical protein [Ramlibacter sp. CGMCC 1.13660]MVQ31613.1 hypothetical protein [Ramlibacter pinisoli]